MMFFKLPNKIIITANIVIGWRAKLAEAPWLVESLTRLGLYMEGYECVIVHITIVPQFVLLTLYLDVERALLWIPTKKNRQKQRR